MTKQITKKRKASDSKDRRSILDMAKALARIQKASPGVYDVTFRLIPKARVEQLSMVRMGDDEADFDNSGVADSHGSCAVERREGAVR